MRRRATDDGSSAVAGGGWTLVVPVSGLATAKSRLAGELDPRARATLVLAMLTDVLSVARATPGVAAPVVVTPDPRVAAHARDLGARVVADPPVTAGAPGGPTSDSLDRTLRTALAANDAGAVGIGVVAADLPELRPTPLGRILAAASEGPRSMLVDHRGTGTAMAFWTRGTDPDPLFGPDSAARYRRAGALDLAARLAGDEDVAAAGRDLDVPADLLPLRSRRFGPSTAAALADLGLPSPGAARATPRTTAADTEADSR